MANPLCSCRLAQRQARVGRFAWMGTASIAVSMEVALLKSLGTRSWRPTGSQCWARRSSTRPIRRGASSPQMSQAAPRNQSPGVRFPCLGVEARYSALATLPTRIPACPVQARRSWVLCCRRRPSAMEGRLPRTPTTWPFRAYWVCRRRLRPRLLAPRPRQPEGAQAQAREVEGQHHRWELFNATMRYWRAS